MCRKSIILAFDYKIIYVLSIKKIKRKSYGVNILNKKEKDYIHVTIKQNFLYIYKNWQYKN